jgi:voltage-gated potassium channel
LAPGLASRYLRRVLVHRFTEADEGVVAVKRRLIRAGIALHAVILAGALGYFMLGGGEWSFLDCLYMTVITLTTVGYGETVPIEGMAAGRVFTLALIVVGLGLVLYFASTLTAFLIDDTIVSFYSRRKMRRALDSLAGHTIVCGVSRAGLHALQELVMSGRSCVVVDLNPSRIAEVEGQMGDKVISIEGDACDDHVLQAAGVERAHSLVASLSNDASNVYCTLSSRGLNPGLHIISIADSDASATKLRRAGADSVVFPAVIGGRRIASELVRPDVVSFMDVMVQDQDHVMRLEQIRIPESSPIANKKLRDSGIREAGDVLVVAMRDAAGAYRHNPSPDAPMTPGETLIVLGELPNVEKVRRYVGGAA